MTVREAFSKAFGPVPEGATCHAIQVALHENRTFHYMVVAATYATDNQVWGWDGYEIVEMMPHMDASGPDISDRPASSFLGFFGEAYDAVATEEVA